MSLVRELSARTLARVVDGTGVTEVHDADGRAVLDVTTEAGTSGLMRVFTRDDGLKVVSTTLAVPARGVVTCMIFAFTAADSAVPHFTLDCGERPDGYAFHLDLVPRVELATHLSYLDEVFEPLSAAYAAGSATAGLAPTSTTRRQVAMMSPWMLVHHADEAAFRAIEPTVVAYADHWLAMLRDGVSDQVAGSLADTDLARHDALVRANLFNPSVDPVWGRVDAMVGPDAAASMRRQLQRD